MVQRRIDSDLRVFQNETALVLGRLVSGGLIQNVGNLRQHEKTVCKLWRHPNLPMVMFAQFDANPPPEHRRILFKSAAISNTHPLTTQTSLPYGKRGYHFELSR